MRVSRIVLLGVAGAIAAREARAQVIEPRTVPVFQDFQFGIVPSRLTALGSATIALDDPLADAFTYPGRSAFAGSGRFFVSPFVHDVSAGRGGGVTIPVGGVTSTGKWTYAAALALQRLDRAGSMALSAAPGDHTSPNEYYQGSVARRVGRRLALGASASVATLSAIDGVDLMYEGADHIAQSGYAADFRAGISGQAEGGASFSAMALHERHRMTHVVRYDGASVNQVSGIIPPHTEVNHDRTDLWGLHGEFAVPLAGTGWRVGALATVNRLDHPKIPDYAIQAVQRDPGTTTAFDGGIGFGYDRHGTTVGVDLIYEPIRTETWAVQGPDTNVVTTASPVPQGTRTYENSFRFNNVIARAGLGHEFVPRPDSGLAIGFSAGLAVSQITYRLWRRSYWDHIGTRTSELWMEWTPSFGVSLRTRTFEAHYDYSMMCRGNCVVGKEYDVVVPRPNSGGVGSGGVVVTPVDPAGYIYGRATLNRVWISVPLP